jgi:hypothetical protein
MQGDIILAPATVGNLHGTETPSLQIGPKGHLIRARLPVVIWDLR